jgi:hypothetical protein
MLLVGDEHDAMFSLATKSAPPIQNATRCSSPLISASRLRGAFHAERRNRGYTLYDDASGVPVARLRSAGHDRRFEVLYWPLWKQRWGATGPVGRTVLSIDDALRFIAREDIVWVMT